VGLGIALALLASAALDAWRSVIWVSPGGSGFGTGEGVVAAAWEYWGALPAGLNMERPSGIQWLPSVDHSSGIMVVVPIWMLLVVIAIPTAFLWVRDRRRFPRGHCQACGYNLTGNVSGVCPECGRKV
jgi:hypothetical protein